jgi:hypothetical protein
VEPPKERLRFFDDLPPISGLQIANCPGPESFRVREIAPATLELHAKKPASTSFLYFATGLFLERDQLTTPATTTDRFRPLSIEMAALAMAAPEEVSPRS